MAQNTGVMREPTMDEIMTSIRDIITENTAQTHTVLQQSTVAQTSDKDSPRPILSENQENRSLSVEDAMNALARRIGLEEEKLSQPSQAAPADRFDFKTISARNDAPPAAGVSVSEQEEFLPTVEEVLSSAAADEQISSLQPGFTASKVTDAPSSGLSHNGGQADSITPKPQEDRRATLGHSVAGNGPHSDKKSNERSSFLFDSLNFEVEQAAEDVLRPLISQWLNDNLPKLINQILREELAKALKN